MPKLYYESPTGKKYYIISKNFATEEAQFNKTHPAKVGKFYPPKDLSSLQSYGWSRDLDIFHGLIVSIYQGVGKNTPAEKAEGRALVKALVAKGADLPPPGSDMSSNSRVPYISYLSRGLTLDNGYVLVLTGKLPQFPKTLTGTSKMGVGQVRYLSFTLYPTLDLFKADDAGIAHASIMDEEMKLNKNGYYTIVYAPEISRPKNWNGEGISWQNSGPNGSGGLVLRWLSVDGGWRDKKIVPDGSNISYAQASWLSASYDQNLVGRNNQQGLLGVYQPLVHYLKKETFERIGNTLAQRTTPLWE